MYVVCALLTFFSITYSIAEACSVCFVQRDEFFITGPNIGMPKAIKIRFDPRGLISFKWHLDRIEVQSSANGQVRMHG